MAKKGQKRSKPYSCTCLYCGKTYNSIRVGGRFDKSTCRVNYFKEKQSFDAEKRKKFVLNVEKLVEPYTMEQLTEVSNRFNMGGTDGHDLIKVLIALKEQTDKVKKEQEKGDMFFLKYLKEKKKRKK